MPLMKYFGFVGSALVLLLIGIGWCFPQPTTASIRNDTERPVIRISSAEPLPERVIIDTRLPTVVPPSENLDASTSTASAQQRLQGAFAELAASSNPTVPKAVSEVTRIEVTKIKSTARREPAKKVVTRRATPPLNIPPAPTYGAQGSAPDTKMSLLETLKERLGQTLFKMN